MSTTSTASLREVKKQRTREAIAAAATSLFDERGYDAVTVAAVAEAAEVGQRTLYRHFPDKEDFLFAEEEGLHDAMRRAAAAAPAGSGPAVIVHAVRTVAETLEPDRSTFVRRARVIGRTPALRAREGLKHVALQQIFVDELVRRGDPQERARLVAGIGVACVAEALARWLAAPDGVTLARAVDDVEAEVRSLAP